VASSEQQRKDAAASAHLQREDAEAREAKAEAQLAAAHAMAAQRKAALLARCFGPRKGDDPSHDAFTAARVEGQRPNC